MRLAKIIFLILFAYTAYSQVDSSVNNISLGKKKIRFIGRNISGEFLGKPRLSFTPIWYKTNTSLKYNKIGLTGKRIDPYLSSDPRTKISFLNYRKLKNESYCYVFAAFSSYLAWGAIGLTEAFKGKNNAFISYYSAPFLGAFAFFVVRSIKLNSRADISLVMSVRTFNEIHNH